jgi:hypothetical protein
VQSSLFREPPFSVLSGEFSQLTSGWGVVFPFETIIRHVFLSRALERIMGIRSSWLGLPLKRGSASHSTLFMQGRRVRLGCAFNQDHCRPPPALSRMFRVSEIWSVRSKKSASICTPLSPSLKRDAMGSNNFQILFYILYYIIPVDDPRFCSLLVKQHGAAVRQSPCQLAQDLDL